MNELNAAAVSRQKSWDPNSPSAKCQTPTGIRADAYDGQTIKPVAPDGPFEIGPPAQLPFSVFGCGLNRNSKLNFREFQRRFGHGHPPGLRLGGVCSDADSKLLLALLACERSRSFSAARWPQPLGASSSVWRRLKYGESAVCYQAASIFPL
jgi:hypothetical protein